MTRRTWSPKEPRMDADRLPTRLWFRTTSRSKRRLAWTRFYSVDQIVSGEAAQDAVAAARREYPKAAGFFFAVTRWSYPEPVEA